MPSDALEILSETERCVPWAAGLRPSYVVQWNKSNNFADHIMFSFLVWLHFWEIFEGVIKHSIILVIEAIPPNESRTPNSSVFSHKCNQCDQRSRCVCPPCLWEHRSPGSQMARNHGCSAGPGLAQGTSGASRAQALHKRLVVLPTAA